MKIIFNSPTMGTLFEDQMIEEIFKYISKKSGEYSLIIGTDSKGINEANFITAVVIYHRGQGGRYFWRKIKKKNIKSLRQRIYFETELSLEMAQKILKKMQKIFEKEGKNFHNKNLEIHIDVGEKGPTRELIKEVVGWVQGNGFMVKTKPESYGASVIADKYS